MSFSLKITRPRARLEAQLASSSSFTPAFGLVRYESSHSNARWWQRTITAMDDQWLRLEGRQGTDPVDTWHMILEHHTRPAIPLPMLALADFVAHSSNLVDPAEWWLFHWVAWALDDLLHIAPAPPPQLGSFSMPLEAFDVGAHAMIDALLTGTSTISWPTTDHAQLQTFVQLGEHLWSFPPALVRQLVDATVILDEKDVESSLDAEGLRNTDSYRRSHRLTGPALLAQLSGWYCWRKQVLEVRGLSIGASPLYFLLTLRQVLVLTHPDAPPINDADLASLCDGMIGNCSQRSFLDLFEDDETINMSDVSRSAYRARVLEHSQEAGAATYTTSSQWNIPPSLCPPLFATLNIQAVRLVSTPQGLWVRLISNDGEWGSVLWWKPQLEPSSTFAFALGTDRNHAFVWSFHEVLWMLWRDIRLSGAPCGLGSS